MRNNLYLLHLPSKQKKIIAIINDENYFTILIQEKKTDIKTFKKKNNTQNKNNNQQNIEKTY